MYKTWVGLQGGFEGGPLNVGIILWEDNADLVANLAFKVRHTSQKYAVLFAAYLYDVATVFLEQRADHLLTWHWADLFVDERSVIGDCKF